MQRVETLSEKLIDGVLARMARIRVEMRDSRDEPEWFGILWRGACIGRLEDCRHAIDYLAIRLARR